MSVTLSSGVRNNLLTLQNTSSQANAIQNRLASGKKVNSAVDNPVNYFTNLSLNNRANQMNGLLDGISNGIQTIQAASKGIDGITKLVNSMQSTIKQAQADAAQNRPTITGGAVASAAERTLTSKSLKDIALDKKLVDDNAGAANTATESYSGNLGVAAGSTALHIKLTLNPGANAEVTDIAMAIDANTTLRDVVNSINGSGVATAFVDEKGQLNVKGTGSQTLSVGIGAGAGATAVADAETDSRTVADNVNELFGLSDANYTTGALSSGVTSAVRSNLIQQFNDLRTQIDELAKDSSFNGLNLLAGDRLTIAFNERTGVNQTKLDIQGTMLTAENLGLSQATNTQLDGFFNFQNDLDLDKATGSLTGALTSLRSLASTLGSNLSVAQTRQDFTKEMINTLTVGADNLVLADSNEEGAKLLALNTRQQLSQTALSLASQADQSVLRLFG